MRRTLPLRARRGTPPDRGPLLTPEHVAVLIGGVSPAWVRRCVPHKVDLGQRTKRWYRDDVLAWLETHRTATSDAEQ